MTAAIQAVKFGIWKPVSTFGATVTAGPATITTGNNISGFTVRIVILAAAISTSGSNVRLTFRSGVVAPFTCDKVYIGEKAGSGDAYDTTSMTEVKWSGASGFSIGTTSTDSASDITAFTLDETKDYVVSFHVTSSGNSVGEGAAQPTNWDMYFRSGIDQASLADATGTYTSDGRIWGLKQIEV